MKLEDVSLSLCVSSALHNTHDMLPQAPYTPSSGIRADYCIVATKNRSKQKKEEEPSQLKEEDQTNLTQKRTWLGHLEQESKSESLTAKTLPCGKR